MAQQSQYQWFDLAKPTIPYISFTSPVNESPHFVQGSQNVLATEIGYLEKRPGFSTPLEATLTTIPGKVVRIFPWRRWGSSFITMVCTISAGVAKVYKLQIATDASFSLIWTSTSATPFDFVVSDNFCFFGNGTDMKKYDGTTVSKWGCLDSGVPPVLAFETGSLPPGMTFSGGLLSGTPTVVGTTTIAVTATDSAGDVATQSFQFVVNPLVLAFTGTSGFSQQVNLGSSYSQGLTADYGTPAYTFSVFSGTLPTGITLSGSTLSGTVSGAVGLYVFALKVTDSHANTAVQSFSIFVSNTTLAISTGTTLSAGTVGTAYTQTITASGGTGPYTFALRQGIPVNTNGAGIYPGFPPGLTFSTTGTTVTISGTPTTPGEYFFFLDVTDSASHQQRFGPMEIVIASTVFYIYPNSLTAAYVGRAYGPGGGGEAVSYTDATGPVTFTFTTGSLNAQSNYVWGYSYTTVYGHESNVSPLSIGTGPFTGLDVGVTVIASSDPQVNGINIYRTTDGGDADPAIMRLVVQLSNTNQTYVDSTPDTSLGLQTGPGFLINTPPPPTIGFVWSNGRIYGFLLAVTSFSGAEEVSNGIPEECWPSGLDGNYYAWPSEVGGQAVTQNGVDIGLSEQFWQISGDTLDTFRKALLLDKGGVRSPTCISAIGNSVQWVDTAKQVWSSSVGEFGEPIRSDLVGIDPVQTFIGYHKSSNYNWVYLLDSLNSKLYIYDLDLNQWNTPWTIAATTIAAGEIALGTLALMVAINGHIMVLTPGTYVDDGATYEDDLKINLIPISPGRLTTGRSRVTPTQLEIIGIETNATAGTPPLPSYVGQLSDDNPITTDISLWTNVTGYSNTPNYQPVGQNIYVNEYVCDSNTTPAIRTATWIQFATSSVYWRIYTFYLGWIRA